MELDFFFVWVGWYDILCGVFVIVEVMVVVLVFGCVFGLLIGIGWLNLCC